MSVVFESDLDAPSAFIEGQEASRLGAGRSECPYAETESGDERSDELRASWLEGWDCGPYSADDCDEWDADGEADS